MRLTVGIGALVSGGIFAAALILLDLNPWLRLVVFLPALVSALGFLQAAFRFCVAFGSRGLFNMDHAAGETESVDKAEFRTKDQKKVVQIWIYSVLIAGAVTVAIFFF